VRIGSKFGTLVLALPALVCGSGAAMAHTGLEHALSFGSGFSHPWTGPDHMLAMIAVGLWAGLNGGRALWAWPTAFVGVMIAGGVTGMMVIGVPMVEQGILATVVVLGLLTATAAKVPGLGAVLVGAFALLHGHAHGAELPAEAAAVSYAVGFAVATALLHILGLTIAHLWSRARGRPLVRGAGGLAAAAGVLLVVT
jgi:urease accessory protein